MGGGWGDFFDKARQPEPWRKWSASPRGRGVREAVRAAFFRCFRGITRGTHRARVGGACVRLCGPHAAETRVSCRGRLSRRKPRHRPPPRDLFIAFSEEISLQISKKRHERRERASLVLSTRLERTSFFAASVSNVSRPRRVRVNLGARTTARSRASTRLDRRWRRPAGRTCSRARHPRARARGARAVGRPAPGAPASAGSRRCSCSASPRSPSRA